MVIKQTHNNHSINLISGLYAGIFRVVKVQIAVYDYDKTTHYSPADSWAMQQKGSKGQGTGT